MDNQDHKKQIFEVLSNLLQKFRDLTHHHLQVSRLSGITNQTYKIHHPHIQQTMIFRKFGDSSENLYLNRETQDYVYQYASSQNVGPCIYAKTQHVRIEQFIPSRVLKTKQMLDEKMVEKVAYALRRFHELSPPEDKIKKCSLFSQSIFGEKSPILEKCLEKMKREIFSPEEQQILESLKNYITKQEVNLLINISEGLQKQPLVFSHNDLLPGNILIKNSNEEIVFIDFQYSSYNYRIYDIANYFNQSLYLYEVSQPPFFEFLKLTPHQELMKEKFIKCYVLADETNKTIYQQKINSNQKLTIQQQKLFQQLVNNLAIGEMLSNYMWGIWSIIVSKNPAIQFDYIKFAQNRFLEYNRQKQKILKQEK